MMGILVWYLIYLLRCWVLVFVNIRLVFCVMVLLINWWLFIVWFWIVIKVLFDLIRWLFSLRWVMISVVNLGLVSFSYGVISLEIVECVFMFCFILLFVLEVVFIRSNVEDL